MADFRAPLGSRVLDRRGAAWRVLDGIEGARGLNFCPIEGDFMRCVCTLLLIGLMFPSTLRAADSVKIRADTIALRIRFGMKDKDTTDWSGQLHLSQGKVESMRGWRWMQGDKSAGNSFTV